MPAQATILVSRIDHVFWVRLEGRGSFQNSLQVGEAISKAVAEGVTNCVVDLERCPIMDSTFLGMLTKAATMLGGGESGGLSIINANPRNLQLFRSLGLHFIMDVDPAGTRWAGLRVQVAKSLEDCAARATQPAAQAAHVLEAHESLANLSEENQCRFQDVIDYLRKELDEQTWDNPATRPG